MSRQITNNQRRADKNMKIVELLKQRRSYYKLDDNIKVSNEEIIKMVQDVTQLVPDAFDMKSQKVVVVLGNRHKILWDKIYDVFEGKVSREKIDMFKAAAGTLLIYRNVEKVDSTAEQFPRYAHNFTPWSYQSNGMLQINLWTGLKELGLGANIQHYNPVIDDAVKEMFDVENGLELTAQMVFGNILEQPEEKEKENINESVKVFK